MNRTQKAAFFDVSLTTLTNWKRQGCPVDGDLGEIAEWRTARKLSREGNLDSVPGLPGLVGDFTRRLVDLDKRIASAKALPAEATAGPGMIRASMIWALKLEKLLLELPGRVLVEASPEKLPEDIHRIVLRALDEARAEGGSA